MDEEKEPMERRKVIRFEVGSGVAEALVALSLLVVAIGGVIAVILK